MKTLFNQNAEEIDEEEINETTFKAAKKKREDNIINIQKGEKAVIYFLKPQDCENALKIAGQIKDRQSIVLNFTDADSEAARRMIDYFSGVVYACKGKINQIGENTFLILPSGVEIIGTSGQEQLEEDSSSKTEIGIL